MVFRGLFLGDISLSVFPNYVYIIVINLMCIYRFTVGNKIERKLLLTVLLKYLVCKLDIHVSVHHDIIYENVQQAATV
jgi:hypothetical protein